MTSYLTSRLLSQFNHKASLIPSICFPFSSFSSSSIASTQKLEQNAQKDTESKIAPLIVSSPHKEFQQSSVSIVVSSSMRTDVKNLINGVDTAVQRLKCEPLYQVDNFTEDELPLEIFDISDEIGQYEQRESDRYMVKIKAPGEDIEAIVKVYPSDDFGHNLDMRVTIDNGDGCPLEIECLCHGNDDIYATFMMTTIYTDDSDDDCKTERTGRNILDDDEFNKAIVDFLAAKGINSSMVDRLIKCVKRKHSREDHLDWLESVKDFVGN